MRDALRRLFDLSNYETLVERNRAMMVYGITATLIVFYAFYIAFVPTGSAGHPTYLEIMATDQVVALLILGFYVISVYTIYATRNGQLERAAWGPPAMWVIGIYGNTIPTGFTNANHGTILFALVILAGLLNGRRGVIIGSVIAIGALVLGIMMRPGLTVDDLPAYIIDVDALVENSVSDFFSIGLQFLGGAGMVYLFVSLASVSRTEGAIQAVEDRQVTAEILTSIAQQVARRETLRTLLTEIVEQINSRFEFIYHTQIFMIDEATQDAQLVASTGAVGRRLLEMKHSLAVGSVSVIGQVTLQGNHIIAPAGSQDSVHRRNEFLPDTLVEAAFPLRVGDQIIGALDVQSRETDPFEDLTLAATFQALADSIALAIDNIRQYEEAERRMRENMRLIAETQAALHEVERLNERMTGQIWSEYLHGTQEEFALAADLQTAATIPDETWTDALKEALNDNLFVQKQDEEQQVIAVPLRIRGRVVGAMEFELDESKVFTPDDFDLVQEVSDRFGMAVESARLMEESRRAAQREALVNQISSRLQASNTVPAMLNEAAQSLHDVLKANKVAIRLGAPPSSTDDSTGNGNA